MKYKSVVIASALCCSIFAALAGEPVEVRNAWVRATVAGQKATGAFMTLRAREGATLLRVLSPLAGVADVHEMTLEGGIMRMRAVPAGLALPLGEAVELKPGGHHIMLQDLKSAVTRGSMVPLILVFRDAKGVQSELKLQVPAATTAPGSKGLRQDEKMEHAMPASLPAQKTP